jgi:hypothetical protein
LKITHAALMIGIGAAVTAPLGVPPTVALADSANVAVAVWVPDTANANWGSYGIYGPDPIDTLIARAMSGCQAKHPTGCAPAGSTTDGCVGLAYGLSSHWEAAPGPDLASAEANAKAKLIADGPTATAGNPTADGWCSNGTQAPPS